MKAFEIVTRNLSAFGNTLGNAHSAALMELVGAFTSLAFGLTKGRFAYPLPTGMGKTQSIIAWCSALVDLNYKDISVAVAASKVEALCQLKRDLIANGVPADSIGLIHSFKHDASIRCNLPSGFASEPTTPDNEDRPIMLVTHNRIHKGNLKQFNEYQGAPRNLLIWDESLLVSNSRFISHRNIKKAFGYSAPDMGTGCEAIQYFSDAISALDGELLRQQSGEEPRVIDLPALSEISKATISSQLGGSGIEEVLHELLRVSQEPLRVAYTPQEGGIISYDITIPRGLESIAILDASYPIRALEKMDKSIKSGGHFSDQMKRYDQVRIHHLKASSGRDAMTKDFSQCKREERRVSAEVCSLVSSIPLDEGIIIFTFKKPESSFGMKRVIDFKGLLNSDLKASGIDVNAELPQGKRIVMLTWGQETSLSEFSYCKHVVFAGVLHRSQLSLASSMAGQADDILHSITPSKVNDVMVSEIAHVVYQALSRGACRMIDGNQAHEMDAWLIHSNDEIRPLLEQVMPGVQWVTWKGRHLSATPKQSKVTESISSFLLGRPPEELSISTQKVKREALLTHVPASTFTKALRGHLEVDCQWTLKGRSLIRTTQINPFLV